MPITVRDCVEQWPPEGAVEFSEHSPEIGGEDVIKHARVSNSGYLMLSLDREGRKFQTNVTIRQNCCHALQEIAPKLEGRTIAEAGNVPVKER